MKDEDETEEGNQNIYKDVSQGVLSVDLLQDFLQNCTLLLAMRKRALPESRFVSPKHAAMNVLAKKESFEEE